MSPHDSKFTLLLMLCAGFVFALGINGYIMPESTDDLIYLEGARNLVEHGAYTYEGKIISDWPPVHSLLLAGVFLIFGSSIVVAKAVSTVMAMVALALAVRVFTMEERRFKWPVLAVYAFLPTGFLCAVRNGSDWTFIALSFVFLLLLKRLMNRRSLVIAILAGLVLGCASLTRHVGVLLGAAVVAQTLWLVLGRRKAKLLSVWPEAVVGVLGASIWLGWSVFLKLSPEGTVAPGLYQLNGSSLMSQFDPLVFFLAVGDYLGQVPNALAKLGMAGGPVEVLASVVIGTILLAGFVRSVVENGFRASDYYVLAYMGLISCYEWKLPRFLIPIGPWLIVYFFEGLAFLGSLLAPRKWLYARKPKWQPAALAAVWCGLAIVMNLLLTFRGHPGKLHGPLFAGATGSQGEFYGEFYQQLSEAGTLISKLPESTVVGTEGFYANYLHAYSGRTCVDPRLFKGVPDLFVQIEGYEETGALPEYAKTWGEVHASGRVRILAPHTLALSTTPKS